MIKFIRCFSFKIDHFDCSWSVNIVDVRIWIGKNNGLREVHFVKSISDRFSLVIYSHGSVKIHFVLFRRVKFYCFKPLYLHAKCAVAFCLSHGSFLMKNIEANESKKLTILVKMARFRKNLMEIRSRSLFFQTNYENNKQFQKTTNFIRCFQSNFNQNSHIKNSNWNNNAILNDKHRVVFVFFTFASKQILNLFKIYLKTSNGFIDFRSDENCIRFWCAICTTKTVPNVLKHDQMRLRMNISSKWIDVFHWLNGGAFLYSQNYVFLDLYEKHRLNFDFWYQWGFEKFDLKD